ncbi:MAG: hypothetical protein AB7S40_00140 [Bacteroidales bacterium]|jgi:predicted small secreted protein
MSHKFIAIILSLLLSNILVSAKNTVTIKGRVVEKTTQNARPFATVIIHTKTNQSKVSFDKNPGVNQDIESYKFKSEYRSHRITISFQYRFGKGKTYKQRNVANIEEASRVNSGN